MEEFGIPIAEKRVAELRQSLEQGPMLNDQGARLLSEEELARFDGLVVQIFGREHPPPHFRVSHQGTSVNFNIRTGERLPKNTGLEKFERNIKAWWKGNVDYLIERWNATRPSDCPVGEIAPRSQSQS
jgi:hypothetical protein